MPKTEYKESGQDNTFRTISFLMKSGAARSCGGRTSWKGRPSSHPTASLTRSERLVQQDCGRGREVRGAKSSAPLREIKEYRLLGIWSCRVGIPERRSMCVNVIMNLAHPIIKHERRSLPDSMTSSRRYSSKWHQHRFPLTTQSKSSSSPRRQWGRREWHLTNGAGNPQGHSVHLIHFLNYVEMTPEFASRSRTIPARPRPCPTQYVRRSLACHHPQQELHTLKKRKGRK